MTFRGLKTQQLIWRSLKKARPEQNLWFSIDRLAAFELTQSSKQWNKWPIANEKDIHGLLWASERVGPARIWKWVETEKKREARRNLRQSFIGSEWKGFDRKRSRKGYNRDPKARTGKLRCSRCNDHYIASVSTNQCRWTQAVHYPFFPLCQSFGFRISIIDADTILSRDSGKLRQVQA